MGTTKSGRYINTKGSGHSASDYAVIHSNEGTYLWTSGKDSRLRLKSGGHGQTGLKELEKYGIKYNIVKTYPNGVRIGNIPDHKDKRKQSGTNQAWFPASWTSRDIRHAGEHVAGLRKNRHVPDGKTIWGIYKGVRVGVMRTHGKIATIFPDSHQSKAARRKR
ncbi:MAG: EndoU domain-containing protein [Lachnospiraceae bacterium]|nr:EndoU domain-containing protein [Lachnospiraceae bacterium]